MWGKTHHGFQRLRMFCMSLAPSLRNRSLRRRRERGGSEREGRGVSDEGEGEDGGRRATHLKEKGVETSKKVRLAPA